MLISDPSNLKEALRLAQAEIERQSQWLPISTAPRDGCVILLLCAWSKIVTAGAYKRDPDSRFPWRFFDSDGHKPIENGMVDNKYGFTHWMALPAPPK